MNIGTAFFSGVTSFFVAVLFNYLSLNSLESGGGFFGLPHTGSIWLMNVFSAVLLTLSFFFFLRSLSSPLRMKWVRIILALLNSVLQFLILAFVVLVEAFPGGSSKYDWLWAVLKVAPLVSFIIGWYMAFSIKEQHHWFLKVLVFMPVILVALFMGTFAFEGLWNLFI